jgi:hypothetical protein
MGELQFFWVPKWGPHPTYFHEHLNIGVITQDLLWHPHLEHELLVRLLHYFHKKIELHIKGLEELSAH